MSIEQRRFPRTTISENTIYHAVEPDQTEKTHYVGTITNISVGGIGMHACFPHALGEELWLEGLEGFSEKRSGRVKWLQEIVPHEQYALGIEFD